MSDYVVGKIEFNRAPYPDWICKTCGCFYGNRPSGNPYGATWHKDKCDVCGEVTEVTEPRDFGHLREWPIKDK